MRSIEARRVLKRHCQLYEEWRCGQATIRFTGKDSNPRFDRRIEIFLSQSPESVDVKKISRLLDRLDRLGPKDRRDRSTAGS
jgi:hypothetical protein